MDRSLQVKGGAEETGALVEEFGTKLSRMVDECRSALSHGEQVLVFSGWARLLKLAADVLDDQSIPTASLLVSQNG
jgi:hypothetical protein